MALSLSMLGSFGFSSGLPPPTGRLAAHPVRMFGGDYGRSPEETEQILKNQPAAFVIGARAVAVDWESDEIQDTAGLKELALKLNPVVGYYDPFQVGEVSKELVAWFRHAEIKHGRVAMAGFVGFCVQNAGIHWPWNLQGPIGLYQPDMPVISFADISAAGGPYDQWDALPSAAKIQILGMIGLFELWGETSAILEMDGEKHYVRGGKPGYFPKINGKGIPHPIPFEFFDPFGYQKNLTKEQKATKLLAEINNGRLAMIGMMGLASASKGLIVPGLDSLGIPYYAGEPMAFFSETNADLPLVNEMLASFAASGVGH